MQTLRPYESAVLGCSHGFFTRATRHGTRAERQRLAQSMGAKKISVARQVHSSKPLLDREAVDWVGAAEDQVLSDKTPSGDALICTKSGHGAVILTADCCPILLAAPRGGGSQASPGASSGVLPGVLPGVLVAAIHAGWRGALGELGVNRDVASSTPAGYGIVGRAEVEDKNSVGGIIENTIKRLQALGADIERTCAAIGPTISRDFYEVQQDFIDHCERTGDAQFLIEHEGRRFFDLPACVEHKLRAQGVTCIDNLRLCTFHHEDSFYSYRRACVREKGEEHDSRRARQLSLIIAP